MEAQDKDLAIKGAEVLSKANSFEISSHEIYVAVADYTKDVKAINRQIEKTFDPIVSKAHQAHKEALAQMKKFTTPLDEAEDILKGKMVGWINQNKDSLDGIPKVNGVSFSKRFTWELIDLTKVDPKFLTIDEKAVNKLVTSLGVGASAIVGGITISDDLSISIRI